jgi:hypothetical protein
VFNEDSVQIPTQRSRILCFRLGVPIMRLDAHQCREASNSSRLHPSGRHGNTFGHFSVFEKISALLYRHGLGRQLGLVRTTGQHHLDAEILDKEIVCIHSASVRTTGQYRPDAVLVMAIACKQSATIWSLGLHRPDAALIWKRVNRVMESRLHS